MTDLKTRVRFTSTVRTDLAETLKLLSKESRINQSKLIDEALEDLFKKHKITKNEKR